MKCGCSIYYFSYVDLRIFRSISESPLDLKITRVDCRCIDFVFRYDKEGTGALHTNQFFRSCGLDPKGRPRQAAPYTPRGAAYPLPRPHSEIAHTNGLDKPPNIKNLLKGGTKINHDVLKTDETKADLSENRVKAPINVPIATTEGKDAGLNVDSNANATDQEKKVGAKEDRTKLEKIKKPKAPPKLDNIIDCLHYKVCHTIIRASMCFFYSYTLFNSLMDNLNRTRRSILRI